jgi:Mn2+/Fe2+ NRAMP family transporter
MLSLHVAVAIAFFLLFIIMLMQELRMRNILFAEKWEHVINIFVIICCVTVIVALSLAKNS